MTENNKTSTWFNYVSSNKVRLGAAALVAAGGLYVYTRDDGPEQDPHYVSPEEWCVTSNESVSIREHPDEQSRIVARIPPTTIVDPIKDGKNGWLQLQFTESSSYSMLGDRSYYAQDIEIRPKRANGTCPTPSNGA